MAFKKNAYAALLFVGCTTVSFTMEQDMVAILRKAGASEENIQKTLMIINKNKTPEEVAKDFHDVESGKTCDINEAIEEFVNIEDKELSLENLPQNKQKGTLAIVASTASTYYNWLTGAKK